MTMLLLVDDNRTLADVYTEGLIREGFEVITAYSGRECLEILKETKPEIILLDIMMPDMDGWETLELIRKIPSAHEIPVLMVTAKALLAEDLTAHGDLIDGFLLKPFSLGDLAGHIRTFERERADFITCMQKANASGADPGMIRECYDLARQITVQKELTSRIVVNYKKAFSHLGDEEEIPEVVRQLQVTCQEKMKRLTELVELLGMLKEPCVQKILEGSVS